MEDGLCDDLDPSHAMPMGWGYRHGRSRDCSRRAAATNRRTALSIACFLSGET